jgi:hypothetical protein
MIAAESLQSADASGTQRTDKVSQRITGFTRRPADAAKL